MLALAAGSLMIVVGNSQFDEDSAFQRQQCLNDAESGLMIGVGWLRRSSTEKSFIGGYRGWDGDNVVIINSHVFDNSCTVTVSVRDNLIPPQAPKTVISNALNGPGSVRLSWDVDTLPGAAASDGFPTVSLSKWRSP